MQGGSIERDWIEKHFQGRVKRFLEIGSYDGVNTSLTAGLVEQGWEGAMVEPNPSAFMRLTQNHGHNPKLTLVNAAVSGAHSVRPFRIVTDGVPGEDQLCTLSSEFAEERKQLGTSYRDIFVSTCTPIELLEGIRGVNPDPYTDWNLLVIDSEGMGLPILQGFPLQYMPDTEIICIETYRDRAEIQQTLDQLFDLVLVNHPNLIFARRSA